MTIYGLLVFDEADELDIVGPWEVFTQSALLRAGGDTVLLVAERSKAGIRRIRITLSTGLSPLHHRARSEEDGQYTKDDGDRRGEGDAVAKQEQPERQHLGTARQLRQQAHRQQHPLDGDDAEIPEVDGGPGDTADHRGHSHRDGER